MGFRRYTFLLSATLALLLVACGDNKHPVFDDADIDTMGIMPDAIDAPDAPPDSATCDPGKILCGTNCVDPKADTTCGTCSNDCTFNSKFCSTDGTSSICCTAGTTNCGGVCVDLKSDTQCGSCTNNCTTQSKTCSTDGSSSICCGAGTTNCGGVCVDTSKDEANCGACGSTGASHVCQGNTASCCNGVCTDVKSNDMNCNACNNEGGANCSTMTTNTQCTGPAQGGGTNSVCCPSGSTANCNGTCIAAVSVDDANCGGCNAACDTANGKHCQASDVPSLGTTPFCCLNTENNCNGTCSDPMTDPNNCGACDPGTGANQCKVAFGETCQQGICCGPGEVNCGGVCVDPKTDPAHCGVTATCTGGAQCTAISGTPVCSDGACQLTCDSGETACPPTGPAACVVTATDPNNCGGCGIQCGPTQVCSNNSCVSACPPGTTNCNGACVDLTADPNHCGSCSGVGAVCPDPTDVCSMGSCCPAGRVVNGKKADNVTPLCCLPNEMNCGGVCKDPLDPATCGACGTQCNPGGTCTNDPMGGIKCCDAGLSRCGANCVDETTSDANCGACGRACTGTNIHCSPSTGGGGPECCDSVNQNNCGGICTAKNLDTACGSCTNDCTASSKTCKVDGTSYICCGTGETNCGGVCVNLKDPTTCGTTCGTKEDCTARNDGKTQCDPTTQTCVANCPAGAPTACGFSCTDTRTDPENCGIDAGQSTILACGTTCVTGQQCAAGVCQNCPTGPAQGCNGSCVNTNTDPLNCGGCVGAGGTACSGATPVCDLGHCCGIGKDWCGAGCVDLQSDEANCGTCGNACTGGATCQSGVCKCGFNQSTCGTAPNQTCETLSIDPAHCGSCTNACSGTAKYCVSNGCVSTCPVPLTGCPTGGPASTPICSNLMSDSNNCGTCGHVCASTEGCVSGACVTKFPLPGGVPGKCNPDGSGGPPLSVPGGPGGTNVCTGELGQVSFNFALCSLTKIGPLSAALFTDGFNSNLGPYKAPCTTDFDCGGICVGGTNPGTRCGSGSQCTGGGVCGGRCKGGTNQGTPCTSNATCTGGGKCAGDGACVGDPPNIPKTCTYSTSGVGINGTVYSVAETSKSFHVGGDFWAYGTIGLQSKGDVTVKATTYVKDGFEVSGKDRFFGESHIRGLHESGPTDPKVFAITGAGKVVMDRTLFTETTPCDAGTGPVSDPPLTINATPKCTSEAFSTVDRGVPCSTDLIDVRGIVEYFRDPAHNDNKLVDLKYNALANPAGDVRLELPCGYYYLDSLGGSQKVTLVVKGRTALFIGGAADIHVEMIFDVQPNASLDMFIGGVVNIAHQITLGSPAYPRLTRMYIGSSSVAVDGATCRSVSDCGGGLCSTCPAPNASFVGYGACTGVAGTCGGGGSNLSQAIDMSQGGNFNGLLWAGKGSFSSSNNVEMYGAIFANYLDFSGSLTVHYDNGVSTTQEECGTPITGGSCESQRDCGNQPCVNNKCTTTCTSTPECGNPWTCDPTLHTCVP